MKRGRSAIALSDDDAQIRLFDDDDDVYYYMIVLVTFTATLQQVGSSTMDFHFPNCFAPIRLQEQSRAREQTVTA